MKLPNIVLLNNKKTKKQIHCPLVIGFFDGIHIGHLQLFKSAGKNFNILTFINIPSKQNNLFSTSSRICNLIYLNPMPKNIFIYDLKKHNDVNFFLNILKKNIAPTKIIVGNNFVYGKQRKFTGDDLKKNFDVKIIKENHISSTLIKKYIVDAKIFDANKLLMIPYYIRGKVIHGKQFGSKLGFKTANIQSNDNLLLPKSGSYLGYTIVDSKKYQSAIFIRNHIVETHLLNGFNKNIYGKKIIIFPLIFTHSINKAKNFDDLKIIITRKINEIKQLFKNS